MADYYLHPIAGNNANSGSQLSPKQYYDSALRTLMAAGDRLFFHRGYDNPIVQSAAAQYLAPRAGTAALPVYYGAWGTGQTRQATVYKANAYDNMIFNAGGTQGRYTVWEDILFDGRGEVANSIYMGTQGANQCSDITLRRCAATHMTGSGFSMSTESSATGASPTNIVLEDCEAYANAVHGIFLQGYNNRILRPVCYGNGLTGPTGGHGVSLGATKTDLAASGWTIVGAGPIYSRTVTAGHTDAVFAMRVDGYSTRLTQYTGATPNTSTPANQFAISGTTLYVNLNGANPNSYTSTYAWKRTYGNLVLHGRMFANRWNRAVIYHEGHGLAADDWADSNFFIGNRVYENEGLGLSNNRGASNCWYGNVVNDNWLPGIAVNPADGVRIVNNTFSGNNSGEGASAYTAPVYFNASCANAVISNNVIDCLSRDTYGINVDPADSGHGGANNLIFGAATPTRSGTFTGTDLRDPEPYLDEDDSLPATIPIGGIPMPNPLRNAGTYVQGVTLRNGRTQPGMTPIGAYQVGRY